jgi:hypothetical protein
MPAMSARRVLRLAAMLVGGSAALACAPAGALANTVASSNWSGYAVHRTGLKFRRVSGSWTQPRATCPSHERTYSSFWVGVGGFSTSAKGLEQIGSELDCNAAGQQRSAVWYELVPAPSRHITMTVKPGDRLNASVTVVGNRVSFRLVDATRGETFSKQLSTRSIDLTSADWITEAPSTCDGFGSCQTLPLTDYGSAHFTKTRAETIAGHSGAITNSAWDTTRLVLSQSSSSLASLDTRRTSTPTSLQESGNAFVVHYGQSSIAPAVRLAAADARAALTLQPGGARR